MNYKCISLILSAFISTSTMAIEPTELLSMTQVSINGTSVYLPKTKNSSGIICQTYIESTSIMANPIENENSALDITLNNICGNMKVIKGQNGFPDEFLPQGVESITWNNTPNGLGYHVINMSTH